MNLSNFQTDIYIPVAEDAVHALDQSRHVLVHVIGHETGVVPVAETVRGETDQRIAKDVIDWKIKLTERCMSSLNGKKNFISPVAIQSDE